MARPQLGTAPTRATDSPRLVDLPGQLTESLGILFAGLALRGTAACNIVFAGSSTTEGSNASDADHRYVNVLTAMIQAAYPSGLGTEAAVVTSNTATFGTISTSAGVHAYNAGEGGTTAATYLTATERTSIAALNPRMVIHMVGGNDWAEGATTPAQYKANLLAVLTDLKAKITGPCVHVLIQPYQRIDVTSPVYPWAAFGQAQAEIAAADPDHVVYIDLSNTYRLVGVPGSDPLNIIDTDNVHQNNAGHALMADLIRAALGIPLVAGLTPGGGTTGGSPGGGTGTGTVIVSDGFNRANAATLGTTDTGQAWSGTAMSIVSNQAKPTTNSHAYVNTGITDMDVTAVVVSGSAAGESLGVNFNADGTANNRLNFGLVGNTPTLFKVNAGASAAVASATATATVTAGTVNTLRVTSIGSAIVGYLNGVQVLTYTLAAADVTKYKVLTYAGLRASDANAGTYDSFTVSTAS